MLSRVKIVPAQRLASASSQYSRRPSREGALSIISMWQSADESTGGHGNARSL